MRKSLPKGTILVGSPFSALFNLSSSNSDLAPGIYEDIAELLADRYDDVLESDADSVLGTDQPQLPGATWKVDERALTKQLLKNAQLVVGSANKVGSSRLNGIGKLVKIFLSEDQEYLALDFEIVSEIRESAISATGRTEFTVHLPRDGSTGPVKKVSKIKRELNLEMPLAAGDASVVKPKIKAKVNQTVTVEIKYLDNSAIDDGLVPTVIPKANVPVALRLKNVKAAWVDGQTAVDLSADYWIVGDTKPKADADYILYVKFADDGGGKKSYRVQALSGTALSAEKKFANSSVTVSIPPKNMGSVCDVVLVEKAVGNPQEVVIDSQDNVFVSGTAPTPTPATVAVELSNAKVERLPKNMARFTVDYKFTSGKADAQKTYRLLGNMFAGKKTQPQAKPFEGKGNQLETQGTLTYEIPYDVAASTKFELYLTEAAGKNAKATVVSNKLAGKMTADAATANVKFQITLVLAAKMQGGAKGKGKGQGQAQSFQLQFQWQLVQGQLNPQATYSCVAALPGNTAPVPLPQATQLAASGTYNQILPYSSGQNAFSFYIVESIPDQQPRTVSNVQNVRVQ